MPITLAFSRYEFYILLLIFVHYTHCYFYYCSMRTAVARNKYEILSENTESNLCSIDILKNEFVKHTRSTGFIQMRNHFKFGQTLLQMHDLNIGFGVTD